MKRIIILLVFNVICAVVTRAQSCKTLTLGQFCDKLESIDYLVREPLTFENYNSFSFKDFKAVSDSENADSSYFRIGFNSKKQIREINYVTNNSFAYTFRVFDFETYRILVQIDGEFGGEYVYDNVAVLMDKVNKYNYMISIMNASDEGALSLPGRVGGVNFKKVEDITAIFILDEQLYPVFLMKFLRGRMIYSADINYSSGHTLGVSDAQVFTFSDRRKELKLSRATCPKTLQDNPQASQLLLKVQPRHFGKQVPPLWDIYGIE